MMMMTMTSKHTLEHGQQQKKQGEQRKQKKRHSLMRLIRLWIHLHVHALHAIGG